MHIICRFGIRQTLIADQGTPFIISEVHESAKSYKIEIAQIISMLSQANDQAEYCSKTLNMLNKKKVKDPKVLFKVVWAHHISRYCAINITTFEFIHRQKAVLLV